MRLKESLHFSKVPPYKYFKIFSGNFHTLWVAIDFIERLGYFLVCSVINAVKHQKVTKTLNKQFIARRSIKCRWHMSEYIHSEAYSFINCHQTIIIIRSLFTTLNVADSSQNKYQSCQAWILVNFTNVAPAHSSIQYRQICWYHLIEETHSYPHVWKFPGNILKYLYGGLLKSVNFFWDALYRDRRAECWVCWFTWVNPHSSLKGVHRHVPWKHGLAQFGYLYNILVSAQVQLGDYSGPFVSLRSIYEDNTM